MIRTPDDFTTLTQAVPHPAALTFAFLRDAVLCGDGRFALEGDAAARANGLDPAATVPVGLWRGAYCRAASLPPDFTPAPGFVLEPLRAFFGREDDGLIAVAGRAKQLAEWARTHRHCGACGTATEAAPGERALRCPACGHQAWPRISPAMMVLVRKGPAILLARHGRNANRWSALAGFLETGESLEETVHREVREEVGLDVRDLRYFASQSWPYPHSLMVAFTAEWAGGEPRPDGVEIAEARFFGPGETLPPLPPSQSVARALIAANHPGAG